MKKNTTTKRGQGTATTKTSSTAQKPTLAKLLSGVMNHPDTPAKMYNSIQDNLGELEADVSNRHSPEFIARVLIESDIQADPAQVSETTEDADEASERTAYLTGRVLRDADDEAFAAFVELAARIGAEPARAEEVLQMCQITEAVRERQRGKRDLADLISAVFTHPDTPKEIIKFMNEGIEEVFNHLDDADSITRAPEFIRAVLVGQPRADEQQA